VLITTGFVNCYMYRTQVIKTPLPFTSSQSRKMVFVCLFWRDSPQWARTSSFTRFLYHTKQRTTVGRTPLDEWTARRTNFYLTTQHSKQTSIHAPGGIRTLNLRRRTAPDPRLRPRGHWDRQKKMAWILKYTCNVQKLLILSLVVGPTLA
jgi:hypothetical protein